MPGEHSFTSSISIDPFSLSTNPSLDFIPLLQQRSVSASETELKMVVSSCNFGGSSHPVVLRSHWHWKVLVGTLLLLVFGIFPSIDLLTMQHVVGDNSVYVPGK